MTFKARLSETRKGPYPGLAVLVPDRLLHTAFSRGALAAGETIKAAEDFASERGCIFQYGPGSEAGSFRKPD